MKKIAPLVLVSLVLSAMPVLAQTPDYDEWSAVGAPTAGQLNAVSDTGYAVGANGILERLDGVWTLVVSATDSTGEPVELMDVSNSGYAVGLKGTVYERVGVMQWERAQTGILTDLYGVNDDGIAVGDGGAVLKRNGSLVWTDTGMSIGAAPDLRAVNNVPIAVGLNDSLYVWDGSTWTSKTSPNLGADDYLSISEENQTSTDTGEIHAYNSDTGAFTVAYNPLVGGPLYGIGNDYAVGENQAIVQEFESLGWQYSSFLGNSGEGTLRGVSESGCFAVGDVGLILEREGQDCLAAPADHIDLVPTGLSVLGEEKCAGEDVFFSATVANMGTNESGNFSVAFYLDSALLTTKAVPSIAPGNVELVETMWTSTAGAHTIEIVVDSGNNVTESNETNNDKSTGFTVCSDTPDPNVTQGPDLVPSMMMLYPAPVKPGDQVTARLGVANIGDENASTFRVRFLHDGVPFADVVVHNLTFNESTIVEVAFPAKDGDHDVVAFVDFFGQVAEADESNNQVELSYDTTDDSSSSGGGGASESSGICFWLLFNGLVIAGVGSVLAAHGASRRATQPGKYVAGIAIGVYGLMVLLLHSFGLIGGEDCSFTDAVRTTFMWMIGE